MGFTGYSSAFIIGAACVIGGIVIIVNIIVITYIIRKRQKHSGTVPVIPLSKTQNIPVEKSYPPPTPRGGSKYGSQYCCDDPNHRHGYGDHFYTSDPLLMGDAAQSNPMYGYVPLGDNLTDGVWQSSYVPTFYTHDPNYQQVHHHTIQSPLASVVC